MCSSAEKWSDARYARANLRRRESMLQHAGFASTEAFETFSCSAPKETDREGE